MNWSDREWRNCVTGDDGKLMSPSDVKATFLTELASGKKFIPMGPCDNFDSEKGCQGHPEYKESNYESE